MHALPCPLLAEIGIPNAWQCLRVAAPFLTVAAGWALIRRMDEILEHFFPQWEWEKEMGWLNIGLERRVERSLRGIAAAFYATLAAALVGIVWGAQGIALLDRMTEPGVLAEIALRLPVLFVSLAYWLLYLGCGLLPKLRRQYEEEGLEKFRAEQRELEREREAARPSRGKSLPKPRFDPPVHINQPRSRR